MDRDIRSVLSISPPIPTVPLERALADTLLLEGELAFVVAVTHALRLGVVTPRAIIRELPHRTTVARHRAQALLSRLDLRVESPPEAIVLAWSHGLDWLHLEPQVTVKCPDGTTIRPDFEVLPDGQHSDPTNLSRQRVFIEVDGLEKYGSSEDWRHELSKEKARENRLLNMGFRVIRVTAVDVFRGDAPAMILDALGCFDPVA